MFGKAFDFQRATPMKLEILTLCESAKIEGTALSIIRAFNMFYTPKPPSHIDNCCVAFRLCFEAEEAGEHSVSVSIIDEDGNPCLPHNKQKVIASAPKMCATHTTNGALKINGIVLPRLGEYRVDLIIDGEALGTQSIYCLPVPSA
jgi:hypothetical protein